MTEANSTPRYGGISDIARELSTSQRQVSRQQVYIWWVRRHRNSFPDQVEDEFGRFGGLRFDLDAVATWYKTYTPGIGGRPRKQQGTDTTSENDD